MDVERARRRIRLRDLETLAAIVEAGGMRRAADALHLTQPAVSKAVRQLEDALGVRLLERGRHGSEPTAFGASLARRSRVVFDELGGALRELDWMADPDRGEVRLGCMETLHAGLVCATTERMLAERPGMRVVLESGQSHDLIEHFLMGRLVEFVVARPLSLPLPIGVEGEPLFRDRMLVAVGHEHRFARRRRIDLDELADEPWILSRNEVMPASPISQAFAARGVPFPSRVVETGELIIRVNLLASGRFVTLVPHSVLPFGRIAAQVRILPIELPAWQTHTMILTLRGRTLGPAAEHFLARLREMARPLVEAPARAGARSVRAARRH